jgi:hypothetical protein
MINSLRSIDTSLVLITPILALIWLAALLLKVFDISNSLIQEEPRWFGITIDISLAVLITVFAALAANRVVQSSVLLGRISNFPLFFMVFLAFIIPPHYVRFEMALLLLLQVALLRYLIAIPEGQKPSQLTFNAGGIIGMMLLIEPWSALLSITVIQAMLSSGLVNLKRILIHMLGLLTPVYFLASAYFLMDKDVWLPNFIIDTYPISAFNFTILSAIRLAVVLLLFGFVSYSYLQVQTSSTLREKRKWQLVISLSVVSFFVLIFNDFGHGIIFMLLPGALVLSKIYLVVQPNRLLNISLALFFALLLVANFL